MYWLRIVIIVEKIMILLEKLLKYYYSIIFLFKLHIKYSYDTLNLVYVTCIILVVPIVIFMKIIFKIFKMNKSRLYFIV